MARRALWGVLLFIALISIWTPLTEPRIAERWFSFPNIVWFAPVPLLTALLAVVLKKSLDAVSTGKKKTAKAVAPRAAAPAAKRKRA